MIAYVAYGAGPGPGREAGDVARARDGAAHLMIIMIITTMILLFNNKHHIIIIVLIVINANNINMHH